MNESITYLTYFNKKKVAVTNYVLDWVHGIGSSYWERTSNYKYKNIIVRFSTFRHKTLFNSAREILIGRYKVKFDLTKSRFNLFKELNDHPKEIPDVSFFNPYVNCHIRVKTHAVNLEDIFFSTFYELRDIVDS